MAVQVRRSFLPPRAGSEKKSCETSLTLRACSCDPTSGGVTGQPRSVLGPLVESYRTERGPRQRTVAYLGLMDEAGRLGVEQAVDPQPALSQRELFAEDNTAPRFVEIDRTRVRVENCRQIGGTWLALELVKRLGLHQFLRARCPRDRNRFPGR